MNMLANDFECNWFSSFMILYIDIMQFRQNKQVNDKGRKLKDVKKGEVKEIKSKEPEDETTICVNNLQAPLVDCLAIKTSE